MVIELDDIHIILINALQALEFLNIDQRERHQKDDDQDACSPITPVKKQNDKRNLRNGLQEADP